MNLSKIDIAGRKINIGSLVFAFQENHSFSLTVFRVRVTLPLRRGHKRFGPW